MEFDPTMGHGIHGKIPVDYTVCPHKIEPIVSFLFNFLFNSKCLYDLVLRKDKQVYCFKMLYFQSEAHFADNLDPCVVSWLTNLQENDWTFTITLES